VELTKEMRNSEIKTSNAHLFYKAVDCAEAVLSGKYINYSMILIAIAVAFLF
jgi:hypothetical protein